MTRKSQVIYAPYKTRQTHDKTIFLSGLIMRMKNTNFSWCEDLAKSLKGSSVTIYNPNRPGWRYWWREIASTDLFDDHMAWEYYRLQVSNIVVVNLQAAEVSLDGIFGRIQYLTQNASKVLVICETGYPGRSFFETTYVGDKIKICNKLDDVTKEIKSIVG